MFCSPGREPANLVEPATWRDTVGDVEELARAVELDEVLHDRCLQELTMQLYAHVRTIPEVEILHLTSATPLTLRLPMTARFAMRTFWG